MKYNWGATENWLLYGSYFFNDASSGSLHIILSILIFAGFFLPVRECESVANIDHVISITSNQNSNTFSASVKRSGTLNEFSQDLGYIRKCFIRKCF